MTDEMRRRLETFLLPLYQDLDGLSRFDEVERVSRIARRIYDPSDEASRRSFELLLLFQKLGSWLDRVGNVSRTALAIRGLHEEELRAVAASLRRLEAPVTEGERALAAALLVDRSGVRGLAERFASARREGMSLLDVVREALAENWVPEWVPAAAREWLEERYAARREVCRRILEENSAS